jgi:hypothetical protein
LRLPLVFDGYEAMLAIGAALHDHRAGTRSPLGGAGLRFGSYSPRLTPRCSTFGRNLLRGNVISWARRSSEIAKLAPCPDAFYSLPIRIASRHVSVSLSSLSFILTLLILRVARVLHGCYRFLHRSRTMPMLILGPLLALSSRFPAEPWATTLSPTCAPIV